MTEFVTYRAFGAKGDGVSDDFAAICAAHEYANGHRLPVKADAGDTYYIAAHRSGAVIKTDTDWTGAKFIFDDSERGIEDRFFQVFRVLRDTEDTVDLIGMGLTSLKAGQTALDIHPDKELMVDVTDHHIANFIREGLNQDKGTAQTDCFLLRTNGTVDPTTPIVWDFPEITECVAFPIDDAPLTIRGGTITTIANQAASEYNYYTTGILISRSNVTVDGLTHYVEGEGDHGAPYNGILQVNHCAHVTVKNCLFTAHYIYKTIGSANQPVSMGTYDIRCRAAIDVTFEDCDQTTDIMDRKYWGLFVSDFCKNLNLIRCRFSRFDAHMGVVNATIRGCTLGHQCLNAIGHGTLTVEDTTACGVSFVNLRPDYGSTWHGDVIIRRCRWLPVYRENGNSLIGGSYHGGHDFGFPCYMPRRVIVEDLMIEDEKISAIYLLGNITPANKDESFAYTYPYGITEKISVKGIRTASGKPWALSENTYMYRDTVVEE